MPPLPPPPSRKLVPEAVGPAPLPTKEEAADWAKRIEAAAKGLLGMAAVPGSGSGKLRESEVVGLGYFSSQ